MNNNVPIEKLTNVLLPSIPEWYYRNTDIVPQRITSTEPYTVKCFLDSVACSVPNKVNIDLTTVRFPNETPNIMIDKTRLFFISSYSVNWITPNVNPRNNNIVFFSSETGLTYSVTVPEGFYQSSALLMAAIVDALNTVAISSGLHFSSTDLAPLAPDQYTLTATGGAYYFILTCSAVQYGALLWNLPQDQVLTSSKTVGTMNLVYTRYIDFCSKTLTRYVTNNSTGNQINRNVVLKVFINNPLTHNGQTSTVPIEYAASTRYRFDTTVANCDIQVRDEFGNFLYLPPENGTSTFWWSLALILE